MKKKYTLWLCIEETTLDEVGEPIDWHNMAHHERSISQSFDSLKEAEALQEAILENFIDMEDILLKSIKE